MRDDDVHIIGCTMMPLFSSSVNLVQESRRQPLPIISVTDGYLKVLYSLPKAQVCDLAGAAPLRLACFLRIRRIRSDLQLRYRPATQKPQLPSRIASILLSKLY